MVAGRLSALPTAQRSEAARSEAERSEVVGKAIAGQRTAAHPNPEVATQPRRRIFTTECRQRILAEADHGPGGEARMTGVSEP
jgi:hypothetical protein